MKNKEKQKEIDEEIKNLSSEQDDLDRKINDLKNEIEDLKFEIETWNEKIRLKIKLMSKRKDEDVRKDYIPDRSDPIDVRIAEYLNVDETTVPIRRIDKGVYMFGRKEIFITKDRGYSGGYKVVFTGTGEDTSIDDLLSHHAKNEIDELAKMSEDQEIVIEKKQGQVGEASPVTVRRRTLVLQE